MKCLEIFLILLFKGDQHPSCGAGKPTVGFPWRPVFLHQQLVSQWGRDTRQACCGDGRLRFEGSPSALPSFPRTEPQSRPLPSKLPPCLHSFWEEIDPLSGFQGEAHGISNVNEKHQWVEMNMVPRHVFAVEPNSLFRGLPWPQGSTDLPVLPVSLRAHVSCSCQIQSFSRELICNPPWKKHGERQPEEIEIFSAWKMSYDKIIHIWLVLAILLPVPRGMAVQDTNLV